jgi:predicted regulator of Ras-like GTPase activity (Roadblock/LC7/MglB family)
MRPGVKCFAEPVGFSGLTLNRQMSKNGLTPKFALEASPSTDAQTTAAVMSVAYGLGRHSVSISDGETTTATAEIRGEYVKEYVGVSS